VRPRRRAFGLAFGAVVLFAVGTSVQAGWLLAIAACLLGAAFAGLILPRRMVRGIEVERRAPAEAFQGDEVQVDLVVTNRSRGVRFALEIRDEHVAPSRAFLSRLRPGERVIVETRRVAARRGVHGTNDVTLASGAPFGTGEARRRVDAISETVVHPRLARLDDLPFLQAAPTPERAMHTIPRRGGGPEYLGIREYRTGDSLRHVHWPSTARHGEVMVREFEREQTRRLAVVVDAMTDVEVPAGETPLDRCCSVAASVAFAAHTEGQGVRLVSSSDGRPTSLSRSGPHELLRWLAELRPGGGMPLAALLGELGPEVLGAETVLLAFPTWRANAVEALGEAVADLAWRAPQVVAVLVEVHTFEGAGRAPALEPAAVDALADALLAAGALVLRLEADTDLTVLARSAVRA
jgi:uncharacterized protein (DUF58 family)